jgi:hypothetical protein
MKREQLVEIKRGQTGTGLLIESDGFIDINSKENKLIKESIDDFKSGVAHDLPRPFVVSAVFQKYGIENANGRIYPETVLKREVEKYQQAIKERRAYGELNHPTESAIDGERICMNIIELHWVGHTLVGKMEIPITEGFRRYGICSNLADTVAQWIISGLRIGVSSRGLGSVTQQMGKLIVGDDYEIVCWDVVTQNSTPGAIIRMEDSELTPFIESVNNDDVNKEVIKEDKYSKFNKWLISE